MMKQWIHYIGGILLALLFANCQDEKMVRTGSVGEKEVWTTLDFGHKDFDKIDIATRSTLGDIAESRVLDLYLYVFVGDRCVYNHYFGDDPNAKKTTREEVVNATEECWYVSNRTTTENTNSDNSTADTHGTLRFRAPDVTDGELYLIANANAYTVNISPDLLNIVRTKQDLQSLTAKLNGDVVTRYGYFPMVGYLDGISITEDGMTQNGNANVVAELVRLDAKIEVKVKANTAGTSTYNGASVTIKDFTPESWQVMNVPKGTYILENTDGNDDVMGYFNTETLGFETSEGGEHSFSFYMLENRFEVSSGMTSTNTGMGKYISDTDYHKRDVRKKDANKEYLHPLPEDDDDERNIWEYAPENATYLILKGYVSMEYPEDVETGTHELGADVTYYIHLGDFVSSKSGQSNAAAINNYAIERNTHYTYSITINGVSNIEVEVTEGTEKQSGATGNIFATQEEAKLFDAHYGQYTYFLTKKQLDGEYMSWYVKSPFGKEGSPKLNNGLDPEDSNYNDALKEYDYKWVWFMINSGTDEGSVYKFFPGTQNQIENIESATITKGKTLLDIDQFVQYMKKAAKGEVTGIFTTKDGVEGVSVTVFVDEYYYEQHPIEGEEAPQDLWKQFVNKPNRLIHILSGSNKSPDGESSITASIITIRQRAIQTGYNINKESLKTAWGIETEDELNALAGLGTLNNTNDDFWFFDGTKTSPTGNTQNYTSQNNGRYNTAGMLGMRSQSTANNSLQWNTILDASIAFPHLKTNYKGLLYGILLRNRDNDGDGYIDADELRWYVASMGQLNEIYIGELGFFSSDARLYEQNLTSEYAAGDKVNYANVECVAWRRHVVSSTGAKVLWAEEGVSTTTYRQEFGWGWGDANYAPYSIRCVRNLGMNYTNEADAAAKLQEETDYPTPLVDYWIGDEDGNRLSNPTITSSSIYYFDLSNVNMNSLRTVPSQIPLDPSDEFNDLARPYTMFRTGKIVSPTGLSAEGNSYYSSLKDTYLDYGLVPTGGTQGYRVPNIREAILMNTYCTNSTWWDSKDMMVSTYYSKGLIGNGYDNAITNEKKYSWNIGYDKANLRQNTGPSSYREVQDWAPFAP